MAGWPIMNTDGYLVIVIKRLKKLKKPVPEPFLLRNPEVLLLPATYPVLLKRELAQAPDLS